MAVAQSLVSMLQAEVKEYESKFDGLVLPSHYLDYAKKCVKPGIEKYRKLFEIDVQLKRIRLAFLARSSIFCI